MDRLFLAIIVSGLLLAAVATSLFVATGGGTSVAVVNPPPTPILPTEKPRQRSPRGNGEPDPVPARPGVSLRHVLPPSVTDQVRTFTVADCLQPGRPVERGGLC